MTVDEAIRRYQNAIITLPNQSIAVNALAELFRGIRAHEDYQALYDAFATAIPASSWVQHAAAMEVLVLDLAECK